MNERHDAAARSRDRSFDAPELELVYPELAEAAEILEPVELDDFPTLEHEAAHLPTGCPGSSEPEGLGQLR